MEIFGNLKVWMSVAPSQLSFKDENFIPSDTKTIFLWPLTIRREGFEDIDKFH